MEPPLYNLTLVGSDRNIQLERVTAEEVYRSLGLPVPDAGAEPRPLYEDVLIYAHRTGLGVTFERAN